MEKRIWACSECGRAIDPRHCFVVSGAIFCPYCICEGRHHIVRDEALAAKRQNLHEQGVYV
jgi:recombinational DNA repair protein (RecF pathway)